MPILVIQQHDDFRLKIDGKLKRKTIYEIKEEDIAPI